MNDNFPTIYFWFLISVPRASYRSIDDIINLYWVGDSKKADQLIKKYRVKK